MANANKIGIVLVGYGAPVDSSPKAITKFCKQMLFDRGIISGNRIVWWAKVHSGMLKELSDEYSKSLKAIWPNNDFPEWPALNALSKHLELRLSGLGEVVVVPATLFGGHDIIDALRLLRSENCGKVLIAPLFPQSSYSTSEIVKQHVKDAQRALHWHPPMAYVEDYHDNPVYISALAASIEHAGFDANRGDKILFAYRSIPTDDIEKGDNYELQAGTTSLLVTSELNIARSSWTMAFFAMPYDLREHLDPYARDVVRRWAEYCDGRMFVVCPGYATECIRTQYYVNETLRKRFIKYRSKDEETEGVSENFVYVPTLGKTRAHLKVLTTLLAPYFEEE